MSTLYLELNMGASGDMLMAALLDLLDDKQAFIEQMRSLNLPGLEISSGKATKCGITGMKVNLKIHGEEEQSEDIGIDHDHGHDHSHDHGHAHDHDHDQNHSHDHDHVHTHSHTHDDDAGMTRIRKIIDPLPVSAKVKADALAVYQLIGEAEALAHDRPIEEVHFHEVGSFDAAADIVGVSLLMEQLAPERITASPVHVGSGQVRCAHGILPVPAPATAHILKDVPTYGGQIRGELCTPTGAALLKHFVSSFSGMPVMAVNKIGYGMGTKDFPAANCVRAFWGAENKAGSAEPALTPDNEDDIDLPQVAELCCNLDDMTGEAIAYAMTKLWQHGALDVFTLPINMKKNRPAVLLTCLCKPQDAREMARLMLQHTSTIGVRKTLCSRYVMQSDHQNVKTSYGDIRIKHSQGYGLNKSKPEFADLAAAAEQHQVSLSTVADEIRRISDSDIE